MSLHIDTRYPLLSMRNQTVKLTRAHNSTHTRVHAYFLLGFSSVDLALITPTQSIQCYEPNRIVSRSKDCIFILYSIFSFNFLFSLFFDKTS